jgi:hypothetical protein
VIRGGTAATIAAHEPAGREGLAGCADDSGADLTREAALGPSMGPPFRPSSFVQDTGSDGREALAGGLGTIFGAPTKADGGRRSSAHRKWAIPILFRPSATGSLGRGKWDHRLPLSPEARWVEGPKSRPHRSRTIRGLVSMILECNPRTEVVARDLGDKAIPGTRPARNGTGRFEPQMKHKLNTDKSIIFNFN